MASCFGISSAIYSFSYSYIFQLELQPYMIFCAILGAVVVMGLGTIFLDSHSSADSPKKESKESSINTSEASSENVIEQQMTEESVEIEKINMKMKELEMPNLNSLKMLISLDFYLVFLIIFIVIGGEWIMTLVFDNRVRMMIFLTILIITCDSLQNIIIVTIILLL